MADLTTRYLGLKLRNPVVAGSSGFHTTADGVRRAADAGAGAVVLKSLFEEQLQVEAAELENQTAVLGHTEAYEYVEKMAMRIGPRDYLSLIEEAKGAVSIPVIASLNCISTKWWLDYASQLVSAGADAIEVNAAFMPLDPGRKSEEIEGTYLAIVEALRDRCSVPLSVKIGPFFTSLPRIAQAIAARGARGLVLFNRFYQFDINVDSLELVPGYRLSTPEEMYLSLRWIAILAGRVPCDLAASTGIHDAAGAVKQLLAGATVVQLCSALYLHRPEHIATVVGGIESWMQNHRFSSLDDFRGRLSQKESGNQEAYERLQYIKIFTGLE